MADKLELLAQKVDQVIDRLESVTEENKNLKKANRELTRELARLRKEYDGLKVSLADKSDTVKTKLTGILDRLDQLQAMAE